MSPAGLDRYVPRSRRREISIISPLSRIEETWNLYNFSSPLPPPLFVLRFFCDIYLTSTTLSLAYVPSRCVPFLLLLCLPRHTFDKHFPSYMCLITSCLQHPASLVYVPSDVDRALSHTFPRIRAFYRHIFSTHCRPILTSYHEWLIVLWINTISSTYHVPHWLYMMSDWSCSESNFPSFACRLVLWVHMFDILRPTLTSYHEWLIVPHWLRIMNDLLCSESIP